MNIEDQNVTAKILSDIKLIRESFTRPTTDSLRSLTEMSQRIATGAYLVTQHMSDKVSIKMSIRSAADALVAVVYETGEDSMSSHIHDVVSATEKLMSYITIARTVGSISDINGLLIEREALKLTRLGSMMLVRGDTGFVDNMSRERSDVRLKMTELFDSTEVEVRKPRPKPLEKPTRTEPVSDTTSRENNPESIRHSSETIRHSESLPSNPILNKDSIDTVPVDAYREDSRAYRDGAVGEAEQYSGDGQSLPMERTPVNSAIGPYYDTHAPATPVTQSPNHGSYNSTPGLQLDGSRNNQVVTPVNTNQKPRSDSTQMSPTEVRRQQILQYIRDNGIVSIKDIADGVRGVSDKTLQRALIDLVNDKIIIRHGDRRWSRYEAVM